VADLITRLTVFVQRTKTTAANGPVPEWPGSGLQNVALVMKTCVECRQEKDQSQFHKKKSALAPRCKPCTTAYRARLYRAQPQEKRDALVAKAVASRKTFQERVQRYKESHPCVDCGGRFHFVAMDFDHTSDDKSDSVSRMTGHGSWKRVLAEIEKCDLVCSNCHRVRTYNRHHGLVTEG
jgi:hypothetical protein